MVMKIYRLFEIGESPLDGWTTDSVVMHQILDDTTSTFKSECPRMRIASDTFSFRIDRLSDDDTHVVFAWMVRWLCERGWEPFDIQMIPVPPAIARRYARFRQGVDE